MKFDKSRVFTAVNAEELKVGSKVIISDTIASLELKVNKWIEGCTDNVHKLIYIRGKDEHSRFEVEMGSSWMLAYLVEEAKDEGLKWTDLNLGYALRGVSISLRVMVIGINIDPNTDTHILLSSVGWIKDDCLKDWELITEIAT